MAEPKGQNHGWEQKMLAGRDFAATKRSSLWEQTPCDKTRSIKNATTTSLIARRKKKLLCSLWTQFSSGQRWNNDKVEDVGRLSERSNVLATSICCFGCDTRWQNFSISMTATSFVTQQMKKSLCFVWMQPNRWIYDYSLYSNTAVGKKSYTTVVSLYKMK